MSSREAADALSKRMSTLLRYHAQERNLCHQNAEGFCAVGDVGTQLHVSEQEILEVARSSAKHGRRRFETQSFHGVTLIRATTKRPDQRGQLPDLVAHRQQPPELGRESSVCSTNAVLQNLLAPSMHCVPTHAVPGPELVPQASEAASSHPSHSGGPGVNPGSPGPAAKPDSSADGPLQPSPSPTSCLQTPGPPTPNTPPPALLALLAEKDSEIATLHDKVDALRAANDSMVAELHRLRSCIEASDQQHHARKENEPPTAAQQQQLVNGVLVHVKPSRDYAEALDQRCYDHVHKSWRAEQREAAAQQRLAARATRPKQ